MVIFLCTSPQQQSEILWCFSDSNFLCSAFFSSWHLILQIMELKAKLEGRKKINKMNQEEKNFWEKIKTEWSHLPKETPIHQHLKGLYITERLEKHINSVSQITASKKNEIRLRKEMLIWNVNGTYFIAFKHGDEIMLWKIYLVSEKISTWENTQNSASIKFISQKKNNIHCDIQLFGSQICSSCSSF